MERLEDPIRDKGSAFPDHFYYCSEPEFVKV
jgi:hypothetical protein